MPETLWVMPALPLAGFVILALAGPRLSRRAVTFIGLTSVGLAAVLAVVVGFRFAALPPGYGGREFSLDLVPGRRLLGGRGSSGWTRSLSSSSSSSRSSASSSTSTLRNSCGATRAIAGSSPT